MKNIKIISLVFILVLFNMISSCSEKKGKDKYPEIPEFPKTTNSNMIIKKNFDLQGAIYYNDSNLIFFSQDTMVTYNIQKKTISTKRRCYFEFYENGLFLRHSEKEYFTIDDENFKIKNIEQLDEYQKYNTITDSLRKESKAPNSEVNQNQLDSIYVKYFFNKYKFNKKAMPIIKYLGNDKFYIQLKSKNFILSNTPLCLNMILSDYEQSENINKKFNYYSYGSPTSNKENYFNNYDYSMMSKYWTSTGGGNHYIPSIPYMKESGFYYYEFDINSHKGKFKIHSDRNYFHDLTKLSNNQFLTTFTNAIYEVTIIN